MVLRLLKKQVLTNLDNVLHAITAFHESLSL
jgi:very-short-patch-repair endonuclease